MIARKLSKLRRFIDDAQSGFDAGNRQALVRSLLSIRLSGHLSARPTKLIWQSTM